jgi:hypothetical protein
MRKITLVISCLVPLLLLLILLFVPDDILISFLGVHWKPLIDSYAEYKLIRSVVFIMLALVGLIASFLFARNKASDARLYYMALGTLYACFLLLEVLSVALFKFIDHA